MKKLRAFGPIVQTDEAAFVHLQGWAIVPSEDGTRFTNDGTGHGMFVWQWSRQSLASLATALQMTNKPDDDLSTAAIDVERDSELKF